MTLGLCIRATAGSSMSCVVMTHSSGGCRATGFVLGLCGQDSKVKRNVAVSNLACAHLHLLQLTLLLARNLSVLKQMCR